MVCLPMKVRPPRRLGRRRPGAHRHACNGWRSTAWPAQAHRRRSGSQPSQALRSATGSGNADPTSGARRGKRQKVRAPASGRGRPGSRAAARAGRRDATGCSGSRLAAGCVGRIWADPKARCGSAMSEPEDRGDGPCRRSRSCDAHAAADRGGRVACSPQGAEGRDGLVVPVHPCGVGGHRGFPSWLVETPSPRWLALRRARAPLAPGPTLARHDAGWHRLSSLSSTWIPF